MLAWYRNLIKLRKRGLAEGWLCPSRLTAEHDSVLDLFSLRFARNDGSSIMIKSRLARVASQFSVPASVDCCWRRTALVRTNHERWRREHPAPAQSCCNNSLQQPHKCGLELAMKLVNPIQNQVLPLLLFHREVLCRQLSAHVWRQAGPGRMDLLWKASLARDAPPLIDQMNSLFANSGSLILTQQPIPTEFGSLADFTVYSFHSTSFLGPIAILIGQFGRIYS